MQLSEHKTYRTRDGSRTGIRVRPSKDGTWHGVQDPSLRRHPDGSFRLGREDAWDLIEKEPITTPAFSYDACPVGPDGRRRAVTRDGREVVLLCDDAPGSHPVVGVITTGDFGCDEWSSIGASRNDGLESEFDLLVPPPPSKPVIWVVLTDFVDTGRLLEPRAFIYRTEEEANRYQGRSIGRPQPYEVDDATSPFVMGHAATDQKPQKRVVWVNLYADGRSFCYSSQTDADQLADAIGATDGGARPKRLGNRAYPIEIDGDAP